mmetsp:Transcript_30521/g.46825  ORF Transcript_30521/g.46825 Transcript_30521/m.46825 type:complete len:96 (-) Transcript_30521:562-849(-)
MPTVPNATVLATATATSRFDALIAGDRAVIAVTPQIDVPAVNKRDISFGNPASLPANGMKVSPAPTDARTTGIPVDPVVNNSKKESLAATATMPP